MKFVRYEESGGQVDYSDYIKFGKVAKESPLVMDFVQR